MTYEIYTSENEAILEIEGNIFAEHLQDFREALTHVAKSPSSSVILDFSDVGAITSYGLRELIMFENQMSKMGKAVNIINASQIVSELISIAKKVFV